MYVRLTERSQRPHYSPIMSETRQRRRRFRSITTAVGEADQPTADAKPIQISLRGDDFQWLEPLSAAWKSFGKFPARQTWTRVRNGREPRCEFN
ncbi:MAG: hypothetical protein L0387_05810 [Acidobacteria bacterium]|nr:hypothetical protein [Acidobacteriota bacterium]MCI0719815.1 hypothetical protein [Acidobacteriota bacterium]